ncbi:ternary protein-Dna Complex1, partial [Neoconidiobolus thromboides FSU 785]
MQQNEEVGKPWSEWDDQRLKAAAEKYNNKGWRKICLSAFPDGSRTKEECLKRWRQLTKSVSVKGLWTAEEDSKLISLVKEMGAEKWVAIANRLETRTGKQCRERWHNHLDPRINKAPFTAEEEQLIFKLHAKIGSKWAEMSKHLPGRSDNSIKNFFNTAMQRK